MNNLALLTANMGKLTDAEAWYRKAIEVNKQLGNAKNVAVELIKFEGIERPSSLGWFEQ